MKTWRLAKTGLTGLLTTTLSYFAGGCTAGPEFTNAPEHLLKYGKPAAEAESQLEQKVEKETPAQSKIDVSDNEFSLVKIKNKAPVTAVVTAGTAGGWDHESKERKNRSNAGARVIFRKDDVRGIANFQDTYQTANANPNDQENQDIHCNIARFAFEGGKTFGEEDAQLYGGIRAGWEDIKLSGILDGWGQDFLVGAKAAFSSESSKFLGMLNINTSLGMLDGMGEHKLTSTDKYAVKIGEDAIQIDGEYGSLDAAITLQQGIKLPAIGELYLVAKGSATYQQFENYANFATYTLAAGADKRLQLADGDVKLLAGIEAFGRHKIEDWKNPNAEDTNSMEWGLVAKLQVEIADGIYAEMYGMVTRPYEKRAGGDHRFGHPEYEAGAQLTLIPQDIFGGSEKDD